MGWFLLLSTVIGACAGALHAPLVYRRRLADGASLGRAAWFGLWTLLLWTLSGAYLLLFWLIGAAGMAIARLVRSRAPLT